MSISLRDKLKSYFSPGSIPTATQFAELIDSVLLSEEDGIKAEVGADESPKVVISSDLKLTKNSTVGGNLKVVGNLVVDGAIEMKPGSADFSESEQVNQFKYNLLPSGTILLWHGDELPEGWALCDGLDGRPKLSVSTEVILQKPVNGSLCYIINKSIT